jgi:hypothetical protein
MSLRHKKQWSLMLLASVLLIVFLCIQVRANLSVTEVLLEFIPMKNTSRTYIQIEKQGAARALRYFKNGLLVQEELEGFLNPKIANQIFKKIENPSFQTTFNILNFKLREQGATEGDLFCLHLDSKAESEKIYCDYTHLAPKNISSVVEELLSVPRSLSRKPLASAYLKCELIPSFRFETLKAAGKLSDFEKLPPLVKPILQLAINKPQRFISLSQEQYQIFLSSKTAPELLLQRGNNGYQLYLYTTPKK